MSQIDFIELCTLGHVDKVREVLSYRKVDATYSHPINGRSALHWAAVRGHFDIVLLLLDYGFDLCAEDKYGKTPYSLCPVEKTTLRTILDPEGRDEGYQASLVNEKQEPQFVPSYRNAEPFLYSKEIDSLGSSLMTTQTTNNVPGERYVLLQLSNFDGKVRYQKMALPSQKLDIPNGILEAMKVAVSQVSNKIVDRIQKVDGTPLDSDEDVVKLCHFDKIVASYLPGCRIEKKEPIMEKFVTSDHQNNIIFGTKSNIAEAQTSSAVKSDVPEDPNIAEANEEELMNHAAQSKEELKPEEVHEMKLITGDVSEVLTKSTLEWLSENKILVAEVAATATLLAAAGYTIYLYRAK